MFWEPFLGCQRWAIFKSRRGRTPRGNPRQYFCDPNAVQRFFSLRDWEIISEQMAESSAIYSVRVESSTKGGIPIIKNWKIFITESEGDAANKYCIITISES